MTRAQGTAAIVRTWLGMGRRFHTAGFPTPANED